MTGARAAPEFRRFVALGDSQTEGVGDEPNADGTERGWADRFAELLASRWPALLYANLAVRGRRLAKVHEQQLPAALRLEPDLASVIAGVNDVMRPRFDIDVALAHVDELQGELRAAGAVVLSSTFPDISGISPAARLISGRLARFNDGVRAIAERHGTVLVDLERWPRAAERRMWCEDRLHLSPEGHRQLAVAMAAAVIGLDEQEGQADADGAAPPAAVARLAADLRWARRFFLPWVGRRLTGRSSGDFREAKRPELHPVSPSPRC